MRRVVYLPEDAEDQEDDGADDGHVELDYPEPFPLAVESGVTGSATGDFVSRESDGNDKVGGNLRFVKDTEGTEKQWRESEVGEYERG